MLACELPIGKQENKVHFLIIQLCEMYNAQIPVELMSLDFLLLNEKA